MRKIFLGVYPLLTIVLLIYSYTQFDLNLTFFHDQTWLSFIKWAQSIGYFQRPLSTFIFSLISILFFAFYIYFLKISGKLSKKQIWFLICSTALILTFSYNAFSYDLFNYIFDAKIVTVYKQNPYLHRALDFPNDPMLLFMHWTHRLYPYGPIWLALTVPLSFIGKGVFILTFFAFKILMSLFYLGTVYFIQKINKGNFGIIFFALNPLVIYESLVSSHNDIAMMFFAILAFYFLLNKKQFGSIICLILSIGIKFATTFLLPVFGFFIFSKKKEDWEKIIFVSVIFMFVAVLIATLRLTFQPWYWLYALPLIALIPKKQDLYKAGIVVSVFGVSYYLPFLYLGNFNSPVPSIIFWTTTVGIFLSVFIILRKSVKIG